MSPGGHGRAPYLVVASPAGDRSNVEVPIFPFLIGRQSGNQLVLRDSRISRLHARLVKKGDTVWAEDCGSTLGLFVNGERVAQERQLRPADIISFGSADGYHLTFQWRDAALPSLVERMPGHEHLSKLK